MSKEVIHIPTLTLHLIPRASNFSPTPNQEWLGVGENSSDTGNQENTKNGVANARDRCPFPWIEIHSDSEAEFINAHLFRYSAINSLGFSRSRPYKKNDNCLVEQKNSTHVRRLVGYLRYNTQKEMDLLNNLYRNEMRLYKNFFQPVIKLISKERIEGKIHRKYDSPKTPYQRLLESDIPGSKKLELTRIYQSSNPAQLKRTIDKKLDNLYRAYRQKSNKNILQKVDLKKKISVRFSTIHTEPISVR